MLSMLAVITPIRTEEPDKTGHFRTFGSGQPSEALRHRRKCLIVSHSVSAGGRYTERGGIHFSKNRPGLNAKSERN